MRLAPLTIAGVLVCGLLFASSPAEAKKRKGRNFSGYGMKRIVLRQQPVPQPSGDIWVYAVNFKEQVRVNIFRKDGNQGRRDARPADPSKPDPNRYDEEAL